MAIEMKNPVLVGVAATNIPHLPLPPMSVVEKDGVKVLRVPFLRKGVFRHPRGNLVLNEPELQKIMENYKAKKSHYGVSLNVKHNPDFAGAMAWFDRSGGKIEIEEDPEFGKLLVAYGKPTTEKALQAIENEQFLYASAEIRPNHSPTQIDAEDYFNFEETVFEAIMENNEEIKLFNPFHDNLGRFSSKSGGGAGGAIKKAAGKVKAAAGEFGEARKRGTEQIAYEGLPKGRKAKGKQMSAEYKERSNARRAAGDEKTEEGYADRRTTKKELDSLLKKKGVAYKREQRAKAVATGVGVGAMMGLMVHLSGGSKKEVLKFAGLGLVGGTAAQALGQKAAQRDARKAHVRDVIRNEELSDYIMLQEGVSESDLDYIVQLYYKLEQIAKSGKELKLTGEAAKILGATLTPELAKQHMAKMEKALPSLAE